MAKLAHFPFKHERLLNITACSELRLSIFYSFFCAADVSEPAVPERQCFRGARLLSKMQQSRGECFFLLFWFLSISTGPLATWAVYFISHPLLIQKLILALICSKTLSVRRLESHYSAWRSIILGCWKVQSIRHNGFIHARLWVPFIMISGSRPCPQKLYRNLKARLYLAKWWHSLTFREGGVGYWIFLKCHPTTSQGGPVRDEKCGFVVLPLNWLEGLRGFRCDGGIKVA